MYNLIYLTRGSFGEIYIAYEPILNEKFIIKITKHSSIFKEALIHSKLQHKNIVKLYNYNFIHEKYALLKMEYCNYLSLSDIINCGENLNEDNIIKIILQLIDVVEYLQNLSIMHGDIKPENILVNTDFQIKLCDFGASQFILKNEYLDIFSGSEKFAPPEILKGIPYNGFKVDIWSVGIILYILYFGNFPKRKDDFSVVLNYFDFENKFLYILLNGMLDLNFENRYNILFIKESDWYINAFRKKG